MRDDYLEKVLRRAGEISALDLAAARPPDRSAALKWAVAVSFGLLTALLPAAGAAQSLMMI